MKMANSDVKFIELEIVDDNHSCHNKYVVLSLSSVVS